MYFSVADFFFFFNLFSGKKKINLHPPAKFQKIL